ncbi:MAG TPA: outer membrane protein transport protein [Thermoanaerobaculia bacterium]|nr:outer membrane protein transport protein [Thermoanaerobaculia bacterium]
MRFTTRVLLLTAAALTITSAAFASGFMIPEQGAKASSMAGAFTALADDPSAIFYNVAGIAQQRRLAGTAGGTFITFDNSFRGDPNDEFTSGATGRYDAHLFIVPNAYAVVPIGDNLTFGIGTFAGFGLRTDWQDPWIGRFVSKDVNLKTASVEPALAWQTSDGRIAVGAGIEYRRARVTLERNNGALNPFTGRIVDVANIYLDGEWSSDIGWNAGVLFKPNERLRLGVSYRADMDIEIEGEANFTQIPTGSPQLDAIVAAGLPPDQAISTTIPFPAHLAVGLGYDGTLWDIDFDITHTTWSRFETLLVEFEQTPAVNLERPQNWEDTMSFRLGGNRRVTEDWDIRLGGLFDQNPQPTEAVGPLLPDSDRTGVSFGAGFHRGQWIADAGLLFLEFQERSTNGQSHDFFNGTYRTHATLYFLNLGVRF